MPRRRGLDRRPARPGQHDLGATPVTGAVLRAEFGLGDALSPVVVLAIGRRDGRAELPEPLAAREMAPRTRRPVGDLLLPACPAPELAAA